MSSTRQSRLKAGHKATLVDVAHKKIAGCMVCGYCRGKGNGACVQKDGMQELYPLLAEAEVLILAVPIYYFTLLAQIQAPIQRIYKSSGVSWYCSAGDGNPATTEPDTFAFLLMPSVPAASSDAP